MDSFEFSSTSPDMMSTTSNSTDASFNITTGGSKKNNSNVIELVNLVLLISLVLFVFLHISLSNISKKGPFWYVTNEHMISLLLGHGRLSSPKTSL